MKAAASSHRANLERLAQARIGRLATASSDGRPHVVPFCYAAVGEVLYSIIDDKPKKTRRGLRRLRNLRENPRASVLVDHYVENWAALWFVMAECEAAIVSDDAEYADALAVLRDKYPQYRRMDLAPATHPLIRLRIERLVAWQAAPDPAPPRTGLDTRRKT